MLDHNSLLEVCLCFMWLSTANNSVTYERRNNYFDIYSLQNIFQNKIVCIGLYTAMDSEIVNVK